MCSTVADTSGFCLSGSLWLNCHLLALSLFHTVAGPISQSPDRCQCVCVCVCMWCMVHVWYLVFLMVFHRDRCQTEASEALLVQSESHGEKSVVCIRKSPRALFVFSEINKRIICSISRERRAIWHSGRWLEQNYKSWGLFPQWVPKLSGTDCEARSQRTELHSFHDSPQNMKTKSLIVAYTG